MTKNSHYVILLYDILNLQYHVDADVVELADTQDLGSCAPWRAGSSPVIRTKTPCENHRGFFCAGRDLESGFKVSAPLRSVHYHRPPDDVHPVILT